MPKVLILGAHTATAQAFIECTEERAVDAEFIRSTLTEFIGPGLVLLDERSLDRADIVVLTMNHDVIRQVARAALLQKKTVVDLAGVFEGLDGAVVAWPHALREIRQEGVVLIPDGPLASVVAALRAVGFASVERASVVTLESAAVKDQSGMDELAEHVRAVFSMRETEPRCFGASLAFDLIPELPGAAVFDADDALKRLILDGLSSMPAFHDLDLRVTRLLVPTFSCEAVVLELWTRDENDRGMVIEALTSSPGLHVRDELVPALDAVGRDDTLVGRVRCEGNRLALWLAYDRLRRGGPTIAALLLETWLA